MPVDLVAYRAHVALAAEELDSSAAPDRLAAVLAHIAADPVLRAVLDHHPRGADHVVDAIADQLASRNGSSRDTAGGLLRTNLLHQIDVLWWGAEPPFATSPDVAHAPDLVDLDPLRARRRIAFRYRRQANALPVRAVRALERRLRPATAPGAGMRYCRARPEIVTLLNELAGQLATEHGFAPTTLWLNSAVRSQTHQDHLRSLGYSALNPSSHCTGYAADITVRHLAAKGVQSPVRDALTDILRRRQDDGELNVIGTGPVWHVCIAPTSLPRLRARFDTDGGVA